VSVAKYAKAILKSTPFYSMCRNAVGRYRLINRARRDFWLGADDAEQPRVDFYKQFVAPGSLVFNVRDGIQDPRMLTACWTEGNSFSGLTARWGIVRRPCSPPRVRGYHLGLGSIRTRGFPWANLFLNPIATGTETRTRALAHAILFRAQRRVENWCVAAGNTIIAPRTARWNNASRSMRPPRTTVVRSPPT